MLKKDDFRQIRLSKIESLQTNYYLLIISNYSLTKYILYHNNVFY